MCGLSDSRRCPLYPGPISAVLALVVLVVLVVVGLIEGVEGRQRRSICGGSHEGSRSEILTSWERDFADTW
jgi:hypothetical protein